VSIAASRAVVRAWVEEGFGAGNLALVDELFAPGFVNRTPLPGQSPDREGVRQTVAALRTAFPDMQVTVEDLVAEGNTVVVRDTTRAIHRGAFAGIPPTGKEVRVARIAIFRLADGRIAEHWGQVDMIGLLQQLGAVPGPGRPPG
jgi:steroid delta-isomerase-like uncharacterized protein